MIYIGEQQKEGGKFSSRRDFTISITNERILVTIKMLLRWL